MKKVLVLCGKHMSSELRTAMMKRDDVVIVDTMPKIKLGQAGSQRDITNANLAVVDDRRFAIIERNTGSNKSQRKRNRKNRWS